MAVSFAVSQKDHRVIAKIARRAYWSKSAIQVWEAEIHAAMDITAAHANGCPLRLDDLLAADDVNFAHDVFGIARHLNRRTGKLEDCFLPRYAVRQ